MDTTKVEIQPSDAHEELRQIDERTDAQEIALGLHEVAQAIRYAAWSLGLRGAATELGALEHLAGEVKGVAEAGRSIADALNELAPPSGGAR